MYEQIIITNESAITLEHINNQFQLKCLMTSYKEEQAY
jgi:hypothetical protein